MKKEFLRVGEAANLLKVTPQTVRKYRDKGFLRVIKHQVVKLYTTEKN